MDAVTGEYRRLVPHRIKDREAAPELAIETVAEIEAEAAELLIGFASHHHGDAVEARPENDFAQPVVDIAGCAALEDRQGLPVSIAIDDHMAREGCSGGRIF